MSKIYITTPIFYVNDLPHIGHAYTTIICDSLARYYRLNEYDVLFTTGTDEHGLKVEKAAKKNKKKPQDFVNDVSSNFQDLGKKLNISNTDFIRTTERRHNKSATFFWNKLVENNQIYLSKYKGWYSVKDESFYQEKELDKIKDNFYTHDGDKVEWIEEESFFFKLSNFQDKLIEFYNKNPNFVRPLSRMNEVKSFVNSGLKDLSISRTSFSWGIKIPNSNNHIMYVWIDALTNYLTSIGYPDINPQKTIFWENCVHIIGKDILKFHAIYWPAMLMAANLPMPKDIFAHGWWTHEGQKISKSLGNTINPNELIDKYGLDQFRYFLLREVPLGNDGDFSETSFISRINADLANSLGNLIQRTLKFIEKNFGNNLPYNLTDELNNSKIILTTYKLVENIDSLIKKYEIHKCLEEIFSQVNDLNKFIDTSEPWKTFKDNPKVAAKDLSILIECFRIIGIVLQPFIPESSEKILNYLNIDKSKRTIKFCNKKFALKKNHVLTKSKPLFPRYES